MKLTFALFAAAVVLAGCACPAPGKLGWVHSRYTKTPYVYPTLDMTPARSSTPCPAPAY
ncbi:MAG: hypothetical protein N2111_14135 [Candidatus Sumerlaeaceae bacterium]|nr:hypothetical protein [Candidatus Sumerlaeaceae bacterium]